jgi:exopolyphosphatase/guanosine-5'-triphosphate,3'-diphosphate pyrophosphatase
MKRFAAIDIGSNSLLLYIAGKDSEGNLNSILDLSEITRLGEGLHKTGFLSPGSMIKSIKVISDFIEIAKQNIVDGIAAVGTMALRTARNSSEFISEVKNKTGLDIEVISGEEEARLSFIGVRQGLELKEKNFVIFDTGGGSTEFIRCENDMISDKFSINTGAIRITEDYLFESPVTDAALDFAEQNISNEIGDIEKLFSSGELIGIGGNASNIASIKHNLKVFSSDIVHNTVITSEDLLSQIKLFSSKSLEERKKIIGLQPKRADIILAGALIIKVIMEKFKRTSLIVSDKGLRHGLIYERFGY